MTSTPLNEEALDRAVDAFGRKANEYMAALYTAHEVIELAVSAYLAVAQPVVNSVEELDALPVGTVVYASNYIGAAERFDVGWFGCGNAAAWSSSILARDGLPATVLYCPEASDA